MVTSIGRIGGVAALLLALWAGPAGAGEVFFSHAAIARALYDAQMTSEGRWFLEGSSVEDCSYALLQDPRVGADAERLRITLLFSGRGAARIRNKCIGPGDSFDVAISGVPSYAAGELQLSDMRLDAPDRAYVQVVRPLLERTLRDRLRFPLRSAADQALRELGQRSRSQIGLSALEIAGIAVESKGVRLRVDVGLDVQ